MMHDPTEGGLATALYELAHAASMTIRLDPAAIRIFDETSAVCDALRLDPMGLLASGALLAIVAADDAARVRPALEKEAINCEIVGRIERGDARVILRAENQATALPAFARDEIARFYDDIQHAEGL
jgi:hydrogenase maturation factor